MHKILIKGTIPIQIFQSTIFVYNEQDEIYIYMLFFLSKYIFLMLLPGKI
jgi:hypothetical protein